MNTMNFEGFTNEELVILAQAGNKEAKQELMIKNDKLVRYCVNKLFRYESPEFCFDELYNEAVIGFCAAIKNFNGESGHKFSTFAVHHMMGRIKLALRTCSDGKAFRIGRDQKIQYSKVLLAQDELRQELLREPTLDEVAKKVEMDMKYVEWLICINNNHCSIQETKFENKHSREDDILIIDSIANEENPTEEQIVLNTLDKEELNKLSERDRELITLRYMEGLTQRETADRMRTSQCMVSRHEKKILKKLREALGGRYDD
mgnify:FL=1